MTDTIATAKQDVADVASTPLIDWIGGAAFGALLSILVGLSATPVVSGVITGLVALLGGLFGLSEKLAPDLPATASRRVAAFGIAAVIVLPFAIGARTRDLLGPSIREQRESLVEMGFTDSAQIRSMLSNMRFGSAPDGSPKPDDGPTVDPNRGILYGNIVDVCDRLAQSATSADRMTALESGPASIKTIARIIGSLPPDQQGSALSPATIYLCGFP